MPKLKACGVKALVYGKKRKDFPLKMKKRLVNLPGLYYI
jgi:hypothetical protein